MRYPSQEDLPEVPQIGEAADSGSHESITQVNPAAINMPNPDDLDQIKDFGKLCTMHSKYPSNTMEYAMIYEAIRRFPEITDARSAAKKIEDVQKATELEAPGTIENPFFSSRRDVFYNMADSYSSHRSLGFNSQDAFMIAHELIGMIEYSDSFREREKLYEEAVKIYEKNNMTMSREVKNQFKLIDHNMWRQIGDVESYKDQLEKNRRATQEAVQEKLKNKKDN